MFIRRPRPCTAISARNKNIYQLAEVVKWQTHHLPFVFLEPAPNPSGISGYQANSTA
jgi:hypothetical protein